MFLSNALFYSQIYLTSYFENKSHLAMGLSTTISGFTALLFNISAYNNGFCFFSFHLFSHTCEFAFILMQHWNWLVHSKKCPCRLQAPWGYALHLPLAFCIPLHKTSPGQSQSSHKCLWVHERCFFLFPVVFSTSSSFSLGQFFPRRFLIYLSLDSHITFLGISYISFMGSFPLDHTLNACLLSEFYFLLFFLFIKCIPL